jgi:hypothetical protein
MSDRLRLTAYPRAQVISWAPTRTFGLVMAATAWHWIDPGIRYQRAREALRAGGRLAFWNVIHFFPDEGAPFFEDLQDAYEEIGEGLPLGTPRIKPGQLPDRLEEIERSGLFSHAVALQFDWETP